jgi:sec-independent protein translocase protein TatC
METPIGGEISADEHSLAPAGAGGYTPPPPPAAGDEEDDEEEGMLRMSFMEHLEELRMRIIRALQGLILAFLVCMVFSNQLWKIVTAPAFEALRAIGIPDGKLTIITPMEGFTTIWVKTPLVASLFLAAPWIVYQVWAFISPGLYRHEKRWAAPFVICTAGLFLLGGLFAYEVAFKYGLAFLLGIGRDIGVQPMVSVTEYFDLFVNVMLGVACIFELPVLIFFLTLLHVASPRFLMRHSRYAILAIVILAAIITPTPDFFNLMLFAVPMCMLFFIGVFASYLLVLRREGRKFPWAKVLLISAGAIVVLLGLLYWVLLKLHYHPAGHWPFMVK